MNPIEVVKLSKLIKALCPAQKFEEDTPQVWHPLLEVVPLDDALEAVKRCGMRLSFIGPADILAEVKVIRRDRTEHADASFVYTGDPDDDPEYRRQLAEHRRAIGDGEKEPEQPVLERSFDKGQLDRTLRSVPGRRPRALSPVPRSKVIDGGVA